MTDKAWLDKLAKAKEGQYIPAPDVARDVFQIMNPSNADKQVALYVALLGKSRPLCGADAIRKLVEMNVCLKDNSLGFSNGFIKAHNRNVEVYSRAVCKSLGYGNLKTERIALSGEFHDIGKIAIPDNILNKPELLTDDERRLHIRPHPDTGAYMLSMLGKLFGVDFEDVIPNVRYHHEWRSGTGYPYGLRESDIPLGAQVISVCDVFDALTSRRPYKGPVVSEAALEIMAQEAGHFDRDLLEHAKNPLLKTFAELHQH
ncbi:MAG: HD domain-containing protein [Candidatus Woesearchaeota archaeon]|nr:HD domain-containing protein [Candidatus Woesearchaeota archaeon]